MVRQIREWPGFFVTDDGRVFGPRGEKKQSVLKHGHVYVSFWLKGKTYKRYVHRLVAEAFIGPIPAGMHVCHEDGNPGNNRLSNLRIDTPAGNAADTARHGTRASGERNGHAKLTGDQVAYIRSRAGEYRGVQREMSRELSVSEATISQVIKGVVWSICPRQTY